MKRVLTSVLMAFVLLAGEGIFLEEQISYSEPYTYADSTIIHLPCGVNIDTRYPSPSLSTELMLETEQKGTGTYLVQFVGPIFETYRNNLERTGAEIIGYLPNYTYLVRMNQISKSAVSNLQEVRWIGDYQPGYKISSDIDLNSEDSRELLVFLYTGCDAISVQDEIENLGGKVLEEAENEWETIIRIDMIADRIGALVQDPNIRWIEPFYPVYPYNGEAQWVIQTWDKENKTRRIWDEGITGEGQVLASMDTGIRTSHNFFRDPSVSITDFGDFPTHRKIIAYQKSVETLLITFGDEVGHGTHTAGSILGNDEPVGGSSVNIGMAPDAKLYFLDATGSSGGIYYGIDLETVLYKPHNGNSGGKASIISNSWGTQDTREYDSKCVQVDRTMWTHPDYLVMFSSGNTDRGDYTGSPANAKNLLAVGGCRNSVLANLTWDGSSVGPAGDGRIRPDIVTPGASILSSSYVSDDAEEVASGTSMSCPIAAGNAALIRQYFTGGYYPDGIEGGTGFAPSAALVKAMMINSVETDYFNHPVPDAAVGWGRPDLDKVLYFTEDTRRVTVVDYDDGLSTGKKYTTEITVEDSGEPLRVTLNWTDYPGQASASPALVNDLNLKVTSPSSKIYLGNVFSNNVSIEGGDPDNLNPTENVFVDNPSKGTWTIEIQGNNIPQGPQPFALVVTCSGSTAVSETRSDLLPSSVSLEPVLTAFPDKIVVRLSIPKAGPVLLDMFDQSGRKVRTLINEAMHPYGSKEYSFAATDEKGHRLPRGVYFLRLSTLNNLIVSKIVLLY